jgi:hypothetical protein
MTVITNLPTGFRQQLMQLVESPGWTNRTIVIKPIQDPMQLPVPHNAFEDAEAAVAQAEQSSLMRNGGRAMVTITRDGQVLYYGKRPPLVLLDKQYREFYNSVLKCRSLLTEGRVEKVPVRGRGASPKP